MHLAAGYNNVEVAEFLLQSGADVNAQDKGGLIPMHNASSYGVSLEISQPSPPDQILTDCTCMLLFPLM